MFFSINGKLKSSYKEKLIIDKKKAPGKGKNSGGHPAG
jgi:hypothetical protein